MYAVKYIQEGKGSVAIVESEKDAKKMAKLLYDMGFEVEVEEAYTMSKQEAKDWIAELQNIIKERTKNG